VVGIEMDEIGQKFAERELSENLAGWMAKIVMNIVYYYRTRRFKL
jgi:hypothetical protein